MFPSDFPLQQIRDLVTGLRAGNLPVLEALKLISFIIGSLATSMGGSILRATAPPSHAAAENHSDALTCNWDDIHIDDQEHALDTLAGFIPPDGQTIHQGGLGILAMFKLLATLVELSKMLGKPEDIAKELGVSLQ